MRSLRLALAFVAACSIPDETFKHLPDAANPDALDAAPDAPPTMAMLTMTPPGDLVFGDVIIGMTSAPMTYMVTNNGDLATGALMVAYDDTTLGFQVVNDTCTGNPLPGKGNCMFSLQFAPANSGPVLTKFHVTATPGGDLSRNVAAQGLIQGQVDIVEMTHDFSSINVDAGAMTKTFNLRNLGQTTIGMPIPTTTGDASYSVLSTTCTMPLTPTGTCTVVVQFDPATVGSKAGSITVSSTMGGGQDSATLAGTGTAHVTINPGGSGIGLVTSSLPGINCGTSCQADFSTSPITLSALPNVGSSFMGWGGDCTGAGSCSLTLDGGKTVGATFMTMSFPLTATKNGNGMGNWTTSVVPSGNTGTSCGANCTSYPYNTQVTLSPTATTGSTFAGWSGDCGGTGNCVVTMDGMKTVTATFQLNRYTLAVTNAGTGTGTVTADSGAIDCGTTCSDQYDHGTVVTLTAAAATGSTFTSWTGCASNPTPTTCTVNMTAARNVSATFTLGTFNLAITNVGSGTTTSTDGNINCGGTCGHVYAYNAPITLTATPATGFHFSNWTNTGGGPCNGSTMPTCTFNMPASAQSIRAIYVIDQYALDLTLAGTGTGSVSSSPMGISCGVMCSAMFDFNTTVTLTAAPVGGATVTWSGCNSASGNTCTVLVTSARSVTTTFSTGPQTLTVMKAGNGTGSVSSAPAGITCGGTCNATFAFNTMVTLTATPMAPASFAGWSGACTNATGDCIVTMNQAQTVTASFFVGDQPLTLTQAGTGAGTLSKSSTPGPTSCAGNVCMYPFGTVVTITQSAGANSVFAGWSQDCSGGGATCVVTMNQPHAVTGTFNPVQRQLIVNYGGTGTGTVTPAPVGTPCVGTPRCWLYDHNTQITLTASPDSGNSFTGWSPICTGSTMPCTFSITADTTETATFVPSVTLSVTLAGTGNGSVTSNIGGINCSTSGSVACSADYPSTPVQTVQLTATPGTDTLFIGWSGGGCTGSTTTCNVTMNQAQSVTATFAQLKKLTVNTTGNGSVTRTLINGQQGGACGANCIQYTVGSRITLSPVPGASAYFAGWAASGMCGTQDPCTVVLSADQTETANFGAAFNLSVTKNGSGTVAASDATINCGTNCSHDYPSGAMVTLTATSNADTVFANWGGACGGMVGNTCTVTMNAAKMVTANFNYNLNMRTAGTGSGSISSSNGGLACTPAVGFSSCKSYPPGTVVSVTNTAGTGSTFSGWMGACTGTGTCSVTMNASANVTAVFSINSYLVRVTVAEDAPAQGTVSSVPVSAINGCDASGTNCQANFVYNSSVTLVATSTNAGRFDRWTAGPCSGSTNPMCTFVMPASAVAATAQFTWFATMTILPNSGTRPTKVISAGSSAISCTNTTTLTGTCSAHFSKGQQVMLVYSRATMNPNSWNCLTPTSLFATASGDCVAQPDGKIQATDQPQCTFAFDNAGDYTSALDVICQ